MKKLVAVLFLTLISLSTFSGLTRLQQLGYEVLTDGDEKYSKDKEDKKEAKEFTAYYVKKQHTIPTLSYMYVLHQAFFSPQPVLDKHTPPPDPAC